MRGNASWNAASDPSNEHSEWCDVKVWTWEHEHRWLVSQCALGYIEGAHHYMQTTFHVTMLSRRSAGGVGPIVFGGGSPIGF